MAGITLEIIADNNYRKEVEDFIRASANGTLFHSPTFLSYHPEEKFKSQGGRICHLAFRKKSSIIAFMPGMVFQTEQGAVFKSPYGGSYGSFIYDQLSFAEARETIELFLAFLSENGVKQARLVPAPPCYSRNTFLDYYQYLLLASGFRIEKAEILLVCSLCSDKEYPLNILEKNARKFYNQALLKGLKAELTEDLSAFYRILVQNRARHNVFTTHTYEELVRIRELFPDRILTWIVYLDSQAIAGALFFLCNTQTANCFYLCHDDQYSAYRGTNLVMVEALKWLGGQGYKWMDFGPSSFGYEPHLDLIRFKESFGTFGAIRYYYLK